MENVIGESAKLARRYLVMVMETRDIYILYIYIIMAERRSGRKCIAVK